MVHTGKCDEKILEDVNILRKIKSDEWIEEMMDENYGSVKQQEAKTIIDAYDHQSKVDEAQITGN